MATSQEHFTTIVYTKFGCVCVGGGGGGGANRVNYGQLENRELESEDANDGEDGNGFRYGFLKKRRAVSSLKYCKTDAAVWMFPKKLLLIKSSYYINLGAIS